VSKVSAGISTDALEAAVSSEAQEAGLSLEMAQALAELSVAAICSVFGGSQIYVPKRLLNEYRDRQIYRLTNGHNTEELAQLHDLSPRHVARIVSKQRKAKGKI
jgi:Mor family transcriptional regulator